MPSQPQNPIPLPSPQPTRPETDRKPAIRTMKSDIEEAFKTTKPSLIKILGQEMERPKVAPDRRETKKYYLLLGGVAVVVALLAILAYQFLPNGEEAKIPTKFVPPPPFFATETSRTVSIKITDRNQFIRLVGDSLQEREQEGIIKRLLIKIQDVSQERLATINDFFVLWRIEPPRNLLLQAQPPLMTFVYYGRDGSRLGLAVRVRDPDRTLGEMLSWESSLLRDLRPLFFDEKPESVLSLFEDRTYQNIDWRYLKLSTKKDLGIGYMIFPARNLLVITTGKEAMETTISRLFETR